jgi:hypothetical protein
LWNAQFMSSTFLSGLGERIGLGAIQSIWCDGRRRQVRIFGPLDQRDQVSKQVLQLYKEKGDQTHAVPISLTNFQQILRCGRSLLEKLTTASSAKKVSLDLKNRSLLVEGSSEVARRARRAIVRILEVEEKESSHEGCCPVCFCPPGEDSIACVCLSCKHEYCRDCFQNWLTGSNLCTFPITCLSEGCTSHITMDELELNLESSDTEKLLRCALDDHIRRNVANLQFCPIPTCPGIYKIDSDTRGSSCSTCALVICSECKASHNPMSCRDYAILALPVDRVRLKIIDEILTLCCPRCHQAFLDFEGCFALSCSVCPCRFCGWCLKDCGGDAHPHVALCPQKQNSDTYFGSKEEFERAQNNNRRIRLLEFLKGYPAEERENIENTIGQDLKDLKITL